MLKIDETAVAKAVVREQDAQKAKDTAIGLLVVLAFGAAFWIWTVVRGAQENSLTPPNAEAIAAGWSSDLSVISSRLNKSLADRPEILVSWSPVVADNKRRYRAIWFNKTDNSDVIRSYVSPTSEVASLSITNEASPNYGMTQDDSEKDVRTLIEATIPNAPEADKASAVNTLVALAKGESISSTTVHGVKFSASSGSVHFTLRARPAK
ncbi:MAG: hypothetical protein H0X27_12400 [Caulobacteraceae bacterium]|nr:hypothetical protein [Caulobacteraceae bacterium]